MLSAQSLKILSEQLDFDDIARNINVSSTNTFRKGVIYNRIIGETENDVWYYDIDFDENHNVNDIESELLDILISSKDYIKELSNKVYMV